MIPVSDPIAPMKPAKSDFGWKQRDKGSKPGIELFCSFKITL